MFISLLLLRVAVVVLFYKMMFAVAVTAPPYGQLSVSGTKLVGSGGQQVALHGNSLFWSQWYPAFWNDATVNALKCNWNANVVRAAMGVDQGGYISDPTTNYNLMKAVIEAAINRGIYVIVDWHVSDPSYVDQAVTFFTNISTTYGSYPHLIYEPFNEPLSVSWTDVLVPYHKKVIAAIRAHDSKNVIVLGTPTWSQDVDVASQNPITGYSNLMYTFHFYAATHGATYRAKVTTAVNNGLPVFVTEYGTCESSGDGTIDESSTKTWLAFLDGLGISYANWAIDDKSESCAALISGATSANVGSSSYWTTSGKIVAAYYLAQSNGVSCSSSSGTTTTTTTKAAGTTTTTTTTKGTGTTTTTTTAKTTTTTKASGSGKLTAAVSVVSTWNGGSQVNVVFTNSGSSAVCSATFSVTLPSGTTIASSWNMNAVSGSTTQYTLPSWENIAAGASNSQTGMTLNGSGTPTVSVLSFGGC